MSKGGTTKINLNLKDAQSLAAFEACVFDDCQELSLFVNGSLTAEQSECIANKLHHLPLNHVTIEINSFDHQQALNTLLACLDTAPWAGVSLYAKLSNTQLERLFSAVVKNQQIQSFSLKGTEITGDKVAILREGLWSLNKAKRVLQHLGLSLAKLSTEEAVSIIRILGPVGLQSLDFRWNDVKQQPERQDILEDALLHASHQLSHLAISVPFGATQGCHIGKVLESIRHPFELQITFPMDQLYFEHDDFVGLINALWINPYISVELKGSPSLLAEYQSQVAMIEALSAHNKAMMASPTCEVECRYRLDCLEMTYSPQEIRHLALRALLSHKPPSLLSLAAKKISQHRDTQPIDKIPDSLLSQLPVSARDLSCILDKFTELTTDDEQDMVLKRYFKA